MNELLKYNLQFFADADSSETAGNESETKPEAERKKPQMCRSYLIELQH